ncbi:MAG: dihydrofolate reductase family protein [Actinomycetota bacterium]|nr:dihydrofolate reductase family protein [Actinomycetota bacterium]
MRFRQLLPEPGEVDLAGLLAELAPQTRAPADRPHVAANFILSSDGHATIGGRSGPLGDDGDRAMFHGLREQFDAVMVGTGTLRTERYGRILGQGDRRRRRLERGQSAEPLACILTRTGSIPHDLPLFSEPEARVVLFTPAQLPSEGWRAQVEQVQIEPGELTVARALGELRARHGVRSVLCEGGPTLFGAMLREGVVDELFLTLAPKLAGGGPGPSATSGAELPTPAATTLRWVLERRDSLYLRIGLAQAPGMGQ